MRKYFFLFASLTLVALAHASIWWDVTSKATISAKAGDPVAIYALLSDPHAAVAPSSPPTGIPGIFGSQVSIRFNGNDYLLYVANDQTMWRSTSTDGIVFGWIPSVLVNKTTGAANAYLFANDYNGLMHLRPLGSELIPDGHSPYWPHYLNSPDVFIFTVVAAPVSRNQPFDITVTDVQNGVTYPGTAQCLRLIASARILTIFGNSQWTWTKDGKPFTVDLTLESSWNPAGVLNLASFDPVRDAGVYVETFTDPTTGETLSWTTTLVDAAAVPKITTQPQGKAVTVGGNTTFSAAATAPTTPTLQWQFNGRTTGTVQAGGTGGLAVNNVQPPQTGLYTAVVANGIATATSDPAILGFSASAKITGAGSEIGSDIFVAANNNTFDQILLQGSAVTVTADPGQITRVSFIDLTDDIVQVEFSGAGTLSLTLDNVSGPALPVNYNQGTVYMKGHANIVIAGANESTNVSVFSVGRLTAVNQTLFSKPVSAYDGFADIGFIAILSTNGKFGGLRTANASYSATQGYTGVYAPGVAFVGPVYVGDINAAGTATPGLILGSADITQINGGDLAQLNGAAVKVSGVTQLKFVAGMTSQGVALPAQAAIGRLEQNGADVTSQLVQLVSL